MTPKQLWLITLMIFLIYAGVFALFLINGVHNNSRHFDVWFEVFLSAIVSILSGIGFGVVAAIIPWHKKGFQYRFLLAFPFMTSLFIIVCGLMWGIGLYMKSHSVHPMEKQNSVEIPS